MTMTVTAPDALATRESNPKQAMPPATDAPRRSSSAAAASRKSSKRGGSVSEVRKMARLSNAQLRTLQTELERERVRVERFDKKGESSSEHHEILMALQRIDNGAYGLCTVCGQSIPVERL
ncbi:MAG: hypothetical protein H3C62_04200, partial [Gemmatimonadaceae bacterium]|nr:hypothetical protein [Gemmatimonadaceae bacterium]